MSSLEEFNLIDDRKYSRFSLIPVQNPSFPFKVMATSEDGDTLDLPDGIKQYYTNRVEAGATASFLNMYLVGKKVCESKYVFSHLLFSETYPAELAIDFAARCAALYVRLGNVLDLLTASLDAGNLRDVAPAIQREFVSMAFLLQRAGLVQIEFSEEQNEKRLAVLEKEKRSKRRTGREN